MESGISDRRREGEGIRIENPFTLKVGQVFTGFGIGCGVGIGVGRPLNLGTLFLFFFLLLLLHYIARHGLGTLLQTQKWPQPHSIFS